MPAPDDAAVAVACPLWARSNILGLARLAMFSRYFNTPNQIAKNGDLVGGLRTRNGRRVLHLTCKTQQERRLRGKWGHVAIFGDLRREARRYA